MSSRYQLADMLSAIKNWKTVDNGKSIYFPHSTFCCKIADVLKDCGYINDYMVEDVRKGLKRMKIFIRFGRDKFNILHEVKLISKPSRRVYVSFEELKNIINSDKARLFIISTSKGVVNAEQALKDSVGGELLCRIF